MVDGLVRRLGSGGLVLAAAALIACVAIAVAVRRARTPEPPVAASPAQPGTAPELIGRLEARLKRDARDIEGWRMLGWSYFETGRYADAARAYAAVTRIDPGKAQDWSALGEATVLAERAGVTPPADAAFRRALAIDPKDLRARYFIGVEEDMAGDHRRAVADWIALLNDTPPGAPWEPDVRRLVGRVAEANHIDIADRLPAASPDAAGMVPDHPPLDPAGGGVALPGPNREQMASAAQLPPAAQDAMVRAMVERLAARLAADPHDADGWVRLMRARMILDDTAGARTALGIARATFAGDDAALGRLADAARALGVPGA